MQGQPITSYAIIVAGGVGTRMQSTVPKQFLLLNGKPVMMHTIGAFAQSSFQPEIIVVLPANFHDHWNLLCAEHKFDVNHQLIAGGETRFHSVKNGLACIEEQNSLVAVQDAVRPLTSVDIINEAYCFAEANGNAVAAVKSRDTVRLFKDGMSKHLNREDIYLVQTPQTFKSALLIKAYEQTFDANFTDDASVAERYGVEINLIDGSYNNIKITYPEDIAIAEAIQKSRPFN